VTQKLTPAIIPELLGVFDEHASMVPVYTRYIVCVNFIWMLCLCHVLVVFQNNVLMSSEQCAGCLQNRVLVVSEQCAESLHMPTRHQQPFCCGVPACAVTIYVAVG
jgi:hypothetical protein